MAEDFGLSRMSEQEAGGSSVAEAEFFTTTTFKLFLMSACTLGLYELYWFYKNWVLIKERTGESIMPFWRAFFAPIWAYSCFWYVQDSASDEGIQEPLPIGSLAVGYFLVQAAASLPDPIWLISFFSFAFIVPVNRRALEINEQTNPGFENNSAFSVWNRVAVVVGGAVLALAVVGTFFPEG